MNKNSMLVLPLLAGTILAGEGAAFAAQNPPRVEISGHQDKAVQPTVENVQQAPAKQQLTPLPPPAEVVSPTSYPQELPTWMPMNYRMPMHYRLLEPETIYGYKLMTPKERVEYMERIHSATTFEEREHLRMEHHRLMQERARARHVSLPDMSLPDRKVVPYDPSL